MVQTPGTPGDGLFARGADGNPLVWDQDAQKLGESVTCPASPPRCTRRAIWAMAARHSVFALATERYLDERYAPESVRAQCGVPAATITRLALEMAHVAFQQSIELPIRWTDMHGRVHDKVIGRPVAMHAMRGVSAHSNGFQTCRALHLLQMLLGALDNPGSFRAKTPYPTPHTAARCLRTTRRCRAPTRR